MDVYGMISALRITQHLAENNDNVDKGSTGYLEFKLGIASLIAQLEANLPPPVGPLVVSPPSTSKPL